MAISRAFDRESKKAVDVLTKHALTLLVLKRLEGDFRILIETYIINDKY